MHNLLLGGNKMSIYAGTVDAKRDKATYDDDGNSVINIIVKTHKTLIGNIKVAVKRTVVLFRGEADLADKALEPGVHVVFGEVTRNPRIYKTKKGLTREVVDMVAESFEVVKPKDFKDNLDELMKMNLAEGEFTFTDEDRATALKAEAAIDSDDSDIPFGE